MPRLLPIVLIGACCAIAPFGALAPVASARVMQQSPGAADRLSDADLEELLAPVALYPDPLLANVLTASCYPDELAQAKAAGGNAAAIDAANWEPSVKAIAKIPDALTMLTEYPDWTKALGEAFILQSQDVMRAVQSLRARAYANGALSTTDQQVVTTQGDTIIIQPSNPQVIYVPTYQPSVVYVDHYDSGDVAAAGIIGFGLGVATGAIIANNVDCDWWGGGCCYGCGWHGGGDYNGGHNTKINIDTGGGDINIGSGNNNSINNIKNNGNVWKPNNTKIDQNLRAGKPTSLNQYRGIGSGGQASGRVPNRAAGAQPIATQRPAPKASSVNRPAAGASRGAVSRPAAQPAQRPASMQRPAAPKATPSIPPASKRPPSAAPSAGGGNRSPAARPSTPQATSRPSAYNSGGGGKAASRGASSRSSAGMSRGGGGGGGGGGRGGGGGGRR